MIDGGFTKITTFIPHRITSMRKIFFIGMLLHFFAHTFINYGLGLNYQALNILRLRKEIWIMIMLGICARTIYYKKIQFRSLPIKYYILILIISIVIIFFVGVFIHKDTIATIMLSVRYSLTGFILWVMGVFVGFWYYQQTHGRITRYIRIIKRLLVGGVIRRGMIYFLPGFIELFGYNKYAYEGQIGSQPPAVYYTNITEGMVRNQFVFERPIHRGMFLVAFWPVFFMVAIHNTSLKYQLLWGLLYLLNVFSTVSRAARLAWLLQTLIILGVIHHKHIKTYIIYGLCICIIVCVPIVYWKKNDILYRSFSNLGHIRHTLTAIQKVIQNPIRGQGPGSAGPASHQLDHKSNYNPENQYLQIRIEYGIFGLLGWLYLYVRPIFLSYHEYQKNKYKKLTKQQRYHTSLLRFFGIGMIGLALEGFFLHSFVDRMIVYPFMLGFGLLLGQYWYQMRKL